MMKRIIATLLSVVLISWAWSALDIQYEQHTDFLDGNQCDVTVSQTYYQGENVVLNETFQSNDSDVFWKFYLLWNGGQDTYVSEFDPNNILSTATYQAVSEWRPPQVSLDIIAMTNQNYPHTFSNTIPDWINGSNPVAQVYFVLQRMAFDESTDPVFSEVIENMPYRPINQSIQYRDGQIALDGYGQQSEIECVNLYLKRCWDGTTQSSEWETCDNWDLNGTWTPWSDGVICSDTCEVVVIPSECTWFDITPTIMGNGEVIINYACQWVWDNFIITQISPDGSTQTRSVANSTPGTHFEISQPWDYTYTCAVDGEIDGCTETYTIDPLAVCNWLSTQEIANADWSVSISYNCVGSDWNFEVELFVDWQSAETDFSSNWQFNSTIQPGQSYQVVCSVGGVTWPQCDTEGEIDPAEECTEVIVTQTELPEWTQISYACQWTSDNFSAMLKNDNWQVLDTRVGQSGTFGTLINNPWAYRVECLIDGESTTPACLYDFTIEANPPVCEWFDTNATVLDGQLPEEIAFSCNGTNGDYRVELLRDGQVVDTRNGSAPWPFTSGNNPFTVNQVWTYTVQCFLIWADGTETNPWTDGCKDIITITDTPDPICEDLSVVENSDWTEVNYLCQWSWGDYLVELRSNGTLIDSASQPSWTFDISGLAEWNYQVICSVWWETSDACQWNFTVDPNAECQDIVVTQTEVSNGIQVSYECIGTWWPYSAMLNNVDGVLETSQWQNGTFATILEQDGAYRVKCLIDGEDAWFQCQEDIFIEPESPICEWLTITNVTTDGLPETITATCAWTEWAYETILLRNGQQVAWSSRTWPQWPEFTVSYEVTQEWNYSVQCYVWWITSAQCVDYIVIVEPPVDTECIDLSILVTDDWLPETISYSCLFDGPWVTIELEDLGGVVQSSTDATGEFIVQDAGAYRVTCYVWDERITSAECMEDVLIDTPEQPDLCEDISVVVDDASLPATVWYSCIGTWWPYSAMLVDTEWNAQTSQWQVWSFQVDTPWIYWIKCLIDGQFTWAQCQDDFLIQWEPEEPGACEDLTISTTTLEVGESVLLTCTGEWDLFEIKVKWPDGTISTIGTNTDSFTTQYTPTSVWSYKAFCLVDGETNLSCHQSCSTDAHQLLSIHIQTQIERDELVPSWVYQATQSQLLLNQLQVEINTVYQVSYNNALQYCENDCEERFTVTDDNTEQLCDISITPETRIIESDTHTVEVNCATQGYENVWVKCHNDDIQLGDTATCDFSWVGTYNISCTSNSGVIPWCKTNVTLQDDIGWSCGDGVVDEWEQCDDGNTIATDGCDECKIKTTVWWYCGDGIVNGSEQCDGWSRCKDNCRFRWWGRVSSILDYCGDGVVDPWEECDAWSKNGKRSICTKQCDIKQIWRLRTEEEIEEEIRTGTPPTCGYVDPPSIQAKELLPIRWEIEDAKGWFACDDIDDGGTVNPLTMQCNFAWIAPSGKKELFTRPCYTQQLKQQSRYGDFVSTLWYDISRTASTSILDTSSFVFDEYGEYRIQLVWIEYEMCIATETTITDSEWNTRVEVETEILRDRLSDQRICQMNVPVTAPYYINKWSSLTSTSDDKVILDRFRNVAGDRLTPLVESSLSLDLASTNQLDLITSKAQEVLNTATAFVEWSVIGIDSTLLKVPTSETYVVSNDIVILWSKALYDKPTTLIVDWAHVVTIKWSLDANIMIVAPEWTIVFEPVSCDIREEVVGIFIAKYVKWSRNLANNSWISYDRCKAWWLTIKWMVVWADQRSFRQLIASRRSTLDNRFQWDTDITQKVFDGASLRIDSDAIQWTELPPLASDIFDTLQFTK